MFHSAGRVHFAATLLAPGHILDGLVEEVREACQIGQAGEARLIRQIKEEKLMQRQRSVFILLLLFGGRMRDAEQTQNELAGVMLEKILGLAHGYRAM